MSGQLALFLSVLWLGALAGAAFIAGVKTGL